jgi:hypothetical protein
VQVGERVALRDPAPFLLHLHLLLLHLLPGHLGLEQLQRVHRLAAGEDDAGVELGHDYGCHP